MSRQPLGHRQLALIQYIERNGSWTAGDYAVPGETWRSMVKIAENLVARDVLCTFGGTYVGLKTYTIKEG